MPTAWYQSSDLQKLLAGKKPEDSSESRSRSPSPGYRVRPGCAPPFPLRQAAARPPGAARVRCGTCDLPRRRSAARSRIGGAATTIGAAKRNAAAAATAATRRTAGATAIATGADTKTVTATATAIATGADMTTATATATAIATDVDGATTAPIRAEASGGTGTSTGSISTRTGIGRIGRKIGRPTASRAAQGRPRRLPRPRRLIRRPIRRAIRRQRPCRRRWPSRRPRRRPSRAAELSEAFGFVWSAIDATPRSSVTCGQLCRPEGPSAARRETALRPHASVSTSPESAAETTSRLERLRRLGGSIRLRVSAARAGRGGVPRPTAPGRR